MINANAALVQLGYPGNDAFSLPPSKVQFSAGGHYGIEVSSVNNLRILDEVLRRAEQYRVRIDRVDECRGIFRLPDDEIRAMVARCWERRIGLVMSVGPRASYDTGGFSRSNNGARVGYRLRGMRAIANALEDVTRAADLGVRGFLVYDEGLLDVLNQLRLAGRIPPDAVFKLSVHAGCANPAAALLFSRIGADTINLIPDLDLSMISAVRQATACPLDLFSDTAAEAGGLIRTYDVPEFIRLGSPVFIKCGAVSQPFQNHLPSTPELDERIKQVRCVLEMIARVFPDAQPVDKDERTLAVPDPSDSVIRAQPVAGEPQVAAAPIFGS